MTKPNVAIVSDSSISLPPKLMEQHNIGVVPFEIVFDGHVYRDGLDIDPPTFYAKLKRSAKLPTTSAPKPSSFLEAFSKASQMAPSVLCLTLASKLSATYNSACSAAEIARESLPGVSIKVVDTNTAAAAEGLLVLEAAKAAAKGATLDEVHEVINDLMPRVHLLGFLDTLYYLGKGGRIPKIATWIGTILSIKPMLELTGGGIRLLGRPRTNQRALSRILAMMADLLHGLPAHVIVVHGALPQSAEELRNRISREFRCEELLISEFTPVIGAHTGPGLLGCAFYTKR